MEPLTALIQDYAWGTTDFIPTLQGREPTGTPEAELWMGAHPKAPSALSDGTSLDVAIAEDPVGLLGSAVAETYGRLPFLTKVLSAAQPLSIQTHPTLEQARAGWQRENEAGVPLDAANRTYRDDNHKPELICALTPFEAKCGFRALTATRELADRLAVPALVERLAAPGDDAATLAATVAWLLGSPRSQTEPVTADVVAAAARIVQADTGPWLDECRWALRMAELYPGDPGTIVALLLNHFTLAPGEALFLRAGVLHAYLHGSGVEVMANSDNVIRGGLTPKHIDLDELGRILDAAPIEPPIQRPTADIHTYDVPVPEFDVTRVLVDGQTTFTVTGPEIVLVTDGTLELRAAGRDLTLTPGQSAWVAADEVEWCAHGTGTLFRTTVGA